MLVRHGDTEGTRVESVEAVKAKATQFLNQLTEADFQHCFQQWNSRMERCRDRQGEYIEGDKVATVIGCLADGLDNKIEIPYEVIPHFPRSTVQGHVGKLVFGHITGVPVVCMKGRFHYYEGYPLWKCAMPVRVMKLLGVTHLIVTNAAGGLNANYKVGDIMLVNMIGYGDRTRTQAKLFAYFKKNYQSCSRYLKVPGRTTSASGPASPMNEAYDRVLIDEAKRIATQLGLGDSVHEGVYTCLGGPNFETVAELKMLSMLGADTVGMSTVHEVITARHCDLTVLAFSLVTNMCVTSYQAMNNPNHEEVIDVGKMREDVLRMFVENIVRFIQKSKK
ncbi:hypothetical protein NQ318_009354 [Aromia moschata]|uniref:purine-nucleoside phosphorylase n=1 Tax=Aromia moschata TaxID=1265417 RepID=A0AAV8X6R1_9CUCU|nr:hypothetical protein NQ318_009354 [Aromia moschata]